jgi:hypothetical protein
VVNDGPLAVTWCPLCRTGSHSSGRWAGSA